MIKVKTLGLLAGALVAALAQAGCFNPYSAGIATPVPVPPWVTERMEEKYSFKNDHRTPVMPPIRPGFAAPLCEDPPGQDEILRAMPHVLRGLPYVVEEFRDDIDIKVERIKDSIDPPRFFPLVGQAQLHHCHWKCTIYYTETIESGYPFPFRAKKPRTEVIYMDKDHLHLYPCGGPEVEQSISRDVGGY